MFHISVVNIDWNLFHYIVRYFLGIAVVIFDRLKPGGSWESRSGCSGMVVG